MTGRPSRFSCEVCVVGAGSGGFGAACAAARLGARVVLLEAGAGVGGTSTWAGVNNWEPVAGATGLPAELYERLRRRPAATCLQKRKCSYRPDRPWGWYDRDLERTDYRLSLGRRRGVPITFEPAALDQVMREALDDTGRCRLLLRTRCAGAAVDRASRRVLAVHAESGDGARLRVEAGVFVDATADLHLARGAGCGSALGPESREAYDEPSASDRDGLVLNNASPCYRVAPRGDGTARIEDVPADCDLGEDDLRPVTSIRTYPNGDLNLNPLQLMTGAEAFALGERAAPVAFARARLHWRVLQTRYGFDGYERVWTSPVLGVRETHRLVARYVLREQDVAAGLPAQDHDDVIALADHALDFHGARPSRELANGPYGVPFRCLQTREFDNLLVACRGAGFSSVAASSCRLSRTMILLGQAAGTAAAMFGPDVGRADPARLRHQLRADGVALDLAAGWLDAMPDLDPARDGRPLSDGAS